MLNDPEFAKNVKGLEGMLRVRERLGESSRVCVFAPNSALHSGRRDAGSVAPGSASVGISGGCGPPLRVSFSGGVVLFFLSFLVSTLLMVVLAFSLLVLRRTLLRSRSRLQLKNMLFFHDQAWFRMRLQVRVSESLDYVSMIFLLPSHLAHLIIREIMVCHPVSALALFLALLPVFLLLLLCLVLVPRVVHCLLLQGQAFWALPSVLYSWSAVH